MCNSNSEVSNCDGQVAVAPGFVVAECESVRAHFLISRLMRGRREGKQRS